MALAIFHRAHGKTFLLTLSTLLDQYSITTPVAQKSEMVTPVTHDGIVVLAPSANLNGFPIAASSGDIGVFDFICTSHEHWRRTR